eukprot:CAMPEP_0201135666 /NCGR_PEP_ID=MMETSP0850-20130426/54442_1 /ASSEMBLY_ACC=CAM_ASM_000622 /TAXON_ID=183588 /ORGANISM="Pseudo-nitzschia fraudulenta, Strain WWA7" /LENGTH=383 /DNA_ID=CAMNT_0047406859 /DNA_START=54 /DNA_END=1206 /DNA_ORIENTATION=+
MRSLQYWRAIFTLTSFSIGARSLNSINLELENTEEVDLSGLGTPNLDLYNATFDLTVSGGEKVCNYTLRLDFNVNDEEIEAGESEFKGNCQADDNTGNANDGLPWHAFRRSWMRFPPFVFQTTGFDHVSIEWLPCGRAPAGFRKARYDVNFYTVTPEYRAFMGCDVFKTPKVCQYNQQSHMGRSHFSLPRLARDPQYLANLPLRFQPDPQFPEAFQYEGLTHFNPQRIPAAAAGWDPQYLANLPLRFQPDPQFPEAFQYEGLTHFNPQRIPATADDWTLPDFLMSTFDAAAVSWRAMIPHTFFHKRSNSKSSQDQMYVYQTMKNLPTDWNTKYDAGIMSVFLRGSGSVCGPEFEVAKEDEIGIIFEDPSSNETYVGSSNNMIN